MTTLDALDALRWVLNIVIAVARLAILVCYVVMVLIYVAVILFLTSFAVRFLPLTLALAFICGVSLAVMRQGAKG
jgi:peptidoglycan/LPS O-acetylase OafA/YrhL